FRRVLFRSALICNVASIPSSKICCLVPSWMRLISVCDNKDMSLFSSFNGTSACIAFNVNARYIAPVSTYVKDILSATRLATVLLQAAAGPSIAILTVCLNITVIPLNQTQSMIYTELNYNIVHQNKLYCK